jgi:hypothetical protein
VSCFKREEEVVVLVVAVVLVLVLVLVGAVLAVGVVRAGNGGETTAAVGWVGEERGEERQPRVGTAKQNAQ